MGFQFHFGGGGKFLMFLMIGVMRHCWVAKAYLQSCLPASSLSQAPTLGCLEASLYGPDWSGALQHKMARLLGRKPWARPSATRGVGREAASSDPLHFKMGCIQFGCKRQYKRRGKRSQSMPSVTSYEMWQHNTIQNEKLFQKQSFTWKRTVLA